MKTLTKVIVFALLAIAVGFGVHYVLREMGVLMDPDEDPTQLAGNAMTTARAMFVEKSDAIQTLTAGILEDPGLELLAGEDGSVWMRRGEGDPVPAALADEAAQTALAEVFGEYEAGGKVLQALVKADAVLFYTAYPKGGCAGFLYEKELNGTAYPSFHDGTCDDRVRDSLSLQLRISALFPCGGFGFPVRPAQTEAQGEDLPFADAQLLPPGCADGGAHEVPDAADHHRAQAQGLGGQAHILRHDAGIHLRIGEVLGAIEEKEHGGFIVKGQRTGGTAAGCGEVLPQLLPQGGIPEADDLDLLFIPRRGGPETRVHHRLHQFLRNRVGLVFADAPPIQNILLGGIHGNTSFDEMLF